MTPADDLGPATGDFRVWLDLALVRGVRVTFLGRVFGADLMYALDDPLSKESQEVHCAKDIQIFFARMDTIPIKTQERHSLGYTDPKVAYGAIA